MKRWISAATFAIFLTACNGNSIVIPSPTPTPAPVPFSKQTQALEADARMTMTNGVRFASLLDALLRKVLSGSFGSGTPVCKNGVEQSVVLTSSGAIVGTIGIFYDPTCTKPLVKTKLVIAPVSATLFDLSGTQRVFAPNGIVVGYGKVTGTTTLGSASSQTVVQGTLATGRETAPILSFGLTCTFQNASSAGDACGFGALNNILGQTVSLGISATIDGFVADGSSSGHVNAIPVTGAPGSLSLKQGSGNTWMVSGGSNAAIILGTFRETVDATTLAVAVKLSGKDNLNGVSLSNSFDQSGMTGSVHLSGKASFQTAPNGNGGIRYVDGTRGRILLYVVI